MAETKLEREYVVPLRKAWHKAPEYERARKAIKEIKKFIARHMKVIDRDISKVKLDVFFNNEVWFRGRRKPPAKVKVKAIKEGEIVRVDFVEIPEHVKFLKSKLGRLHKKSEKKEEKPKEEAKTEEKLDKKTEEEKKEDKEEKQEEKEKEKAVAEVHAKEAEQQAKVQKHLTKKKETGFHRMALKK